MRRASVRLLVANALAAASNWMFWCKLARTQASKRSTMGSAWARWSAITYADCEGRESTIKYLATRAASSGLDWRISHSAISRWLSAAPAVTKGPERTIMRLASSLTAG